MEQDATQMILFARTQSETILGRDDRVDKRKRAGASPWNRVKSSHKVRCLIGNIEFSVPQEVCDQFLYLCQSQPTTVREAAESCLTRLVMQSSTQP